jgi:hypothetical protein
VKAGGTPALLGLLELGLDLAERPNRVGVSLRNVVLISVFQRFKTQEIPNTNFDIENCYELFSVINF